MSVDLKSTRGLCAVLALVCLYVFREGAKGWRVTMEMFGWGTFQ
jgi:hypothetical protein